jgi:hypothetical protein
MLIKQLIKEPQHTQVVLNLMHPFCKKKQPNMFQLLHGLNIE